MWTATTDILSPSPFGGQRSLAGTHQRLASGCCVCALLDTLTGVFHEAFRDFRQKLVGFLFFGFRLTEKFGDLCAADLFSYRSCRSVTRHFVMLDLLGRDNQCQIRDVIALLFSRRDCLLSLGDQPKHRLAGFSFDFGIQQPKGPILQDLLHAEGQLLKALPKMAKAAHDPKLKTAFEAHLKETEGQVERFNNS